MSASETPAALASALRERDGLWAVVLAGGEGARLRAFVRGLFDDERLRCAPQDENAPITRG